jgi:hypothetical protein
MRPMTVHYLLLLLVALSLTGCKQFSILGFGTDQARDTRPKLVMVSGQSNAERLYTWGGLGGWSQVRGIEDTFVNCSRGGAKIDDFNTSGSILQNCFKELGDRHPDVILWYQGEADAVDGLYATHDMKTLALFRSFQAKWPGVKIIYAQLHTVDDTRWPGFNRWNEIKDQQAQYSVNDTIMIRTDDIHPGPCDGQGDGIHYDQPGVVILGQRFAQGYKRLTLGE